MSEKKVKQDVEHYKKLIKKLKKNHNTDTQELRDQVGQLNDLVTSYRNCMVAFCLRDNGKVVVSQKEIMKVDKEKYGIDIHVDDKGNIVFEAIEPTK